MSAYYVDMNTLTNTRIRRIIYTLPTGRVIFRNTFEGREQRTMTSLGAVKWHVANTNGRF